ncbi:helix-turn-helix transcriptional regulator [Candidatus Woesebacteria bacterium]|nr:helix-turn-helix transcriptional regulator [Candidatus Woesebacteria bacterium]
MQNCVKSVRTKKKVTQEELAEAVGVTRQTIIALEKGNYVPSLLLALCIAHYFDTSVERLFHIDTSKGCLS